VREKMVETLMMEAPGAQVRRHGAHQVPRQPSRLPAASRDGLGVVAPRLAQRLQLPALQ
jgi:hypothetical protein